MEKTVMNILLADDDCETAAVLSLALKKIGGHSVTLATSGQKALDLALSNQFDVILLDSQMPELTGFQVCQQYHQKCLKPSPIIFITGEADSPFVKRAIKCGAKGVISKPFHPKDICKKISTILDEKEQVKAS